MQQLLLIPKHQYVVRLVGQNKLGEARYCREFKFGDDENAARIFLSVYRRNAFVQSATIHLENYWVGH